MGVPPKRLACKYEYVTISPVINDKGWVVNHRPAAVEVVSLCEVEKINNISLLAFNFNC